MLTFLNNHNGTVFVEANQPPILGQSAGTYGTTLDESDLLSMLAVIRDDDPEPEKLTATREQLAGDR